MTNKKYENYLLEVKENVAIFTINREKVLNAVSESCFRELYEFLCEAEEDPEIKVIIFTGAGRKSFISGADISGFSSAGTPTALKTRWADRAANKLETCAKPVIAAVNGYAFGGGFELSLACDIRIASENARFGLPEPKLGLTRTWRHSETCKDNRRRKNKRGSFGRARIYGKRSGRDRTRNEVRTLGRSYG